MQETWQLMATAPRDGTLVLLVTPRYGLEVGGWSPPAQAWLTWCCCRPIEAPTHWMPLPEIPDAREAAAIAAWSGA